MRLTAIILLLITGLKALAACYGFMADPSGKGLGMTIGYLQFSSFDSFLIPGIILFCTIGLLSIAAAISAIIKVKHYPTFIISHIIHIRISHRRTL